MSKRPELTAAERALPYAKFYDLPITPIPEEKLAVLAAGPIDPSLALKIEDRNDLFKPGYLPCEIGYCVMPNGTGFLANRTEMPGVTPEMFEWWFAWHSLEDLRYRIWDPEDHYYARQQMREKTLDQSLPMRERTWGTVHHVLEDIGCPGSLQLGCAGKYAEGKSAVWSASARSAVQTHFSPNDSGTGQTLCCSSTAHSADNPAGLIHRRTGGSL